jgi:hypothetical protein
MSKQKKKTKIENSDEDIGKIVFWASRGKKKNKDKQKVLFRCLIELSPTFYFFQF